MVCGEPWRRWRKSALFFLVSADKLNKAILQTNFKYEAVLPCKVYDDPELIVKAIMDVENYDFAKINKFNETFICNNDGSAVQKLLVKLGL